MKRNKNNKKGKGESLFKFYAEVGELIVSNGAYDERRSNKLDELTIGYRKIFSPSTMKVVYSITAYPNQLDREFFKKARSAIEGYGVVLNFNVRMRPHTIDWSDPSMKEKKQLVEKYVSDNKGNTNYFSTKEDNVEVEKTKILAQTFGYFTSIEMRSHQLCLVDIMMELCRVKEDDRARIQFVESQKRLKNYFSLQDFQIKEVKFNLFDYLKFRSPTSAFKRELLPDETSVILSDEIVARMPGYSAGAIGDSGLFLGRDVTTNKFVYKNFVRSGGQAENFLVIAGTGSGKSFWMKVFIPMAIAAGFNVVALDIDGDYIPEVKYLNGHVISFRDGYFDTLVISDPTGDESIDSELLRESREATTTVFSCLTDIEKGMTSDEVKIFTEAYNRMYDDNSIIMDDRTTWGNSSKLSYHMLYNYICDLQNDEQALKIGVSLDTINKFVAKLSTFFDEKGLRSHMFRKKVTINEILNRQSKDPMCLDIFLDIQKNATEGEELIGQTVKQLTANYLTTLIANRNKSEGQFTMEIIEEYQRYSHQPKVASMILNKVTGNRKRNVSTFLITNSPLELLRNNSASAYAVIENINNYVIGAIKPKTIEEVCKVFSLDNCEDILHKLATSNRFKHCFMLKLNGREVAIAKYDVPKKLVDSPLFKSRDTEMKEKEVKSLKWKDTNERGKTSGVSVEKRLTGRRTAK